MAEEQTKIAEKSLSEQLAEGLVVPEPHQKVEVDEAGELRLVDKSLAEQAAEGLVALEPHQKVEADETGEERIVDKSLEEQVAEGLVKLDDTQSLEGRGAEARIVPRPPEVLLSEGKRTPAELLKAGLVTHEQVKEHGLRRLRREVSAHFAEQTTASGYPLDDLARQKASFSYIFRVLPGAETTKQELLESGLIYPDDVLDEILDEIGKVQGAYRAARVATVRGFEKGESVEKWGRVKLRDHLGKGGGSGKPGGGSGSLPGGGSGSLPDGATGSASAGEPDAPPSAPGLPSARTSRRSARKSRKS